MKINLITKKEGVKIIISYEPKGLFMFEDNGYFIGIDNSTGNCWVEEFITEDLCIKWLKGEIEISDSRIEM